MTAGHGAVDVAAEDGLDVDRLRADLQPAGVDARDVEQLGDQPGDAVGVRLDGLEHEPLLVVAEPVPAAQQGGGEALDRGQRRAQLVGDGGDDGGVLGLGAAAVHGVAHQDVDLVDRLVAAGPQVLRGDEDLTTVVPHHEQLLAVTGADAQPTPGVGHRPPGGAVAVLQVDRLADVGPDERPRGPPDEAAGAGVEEDDRPSPSAATRPSGMSSAATTGGRGVHQHPGREVHGADPNGSVRAAEAKRQMVAAMARLSDSALP